MRTLWMFFPIGIVLLLWTHTVPAQDEPEGVLTLAPGTYLYLDHPAILEVLHHGGITIEGWFYPDDHHPWGEWVLFAKPRSYSVTFYKHATGVQIRHEVLRHLGASGGGAQRSGDEFWDRWFHVALQIEGKACGTSGEMLPDGTFSYVGCGRGPSLDVPTKLYIGGVPTEERRPGSRTLGGWIDEIRISSTQRYFAANVVRPPRKFEADDDTLALWRFDDGPPYVDASGHGYVLHMGDELPIHERGRLAVTWAALRASP